MKGASDKMREASIQAYNKLKRYPGPCMFPVKCNNPSIRAHAVQRKGPLKLVAESGGFVLAPDGEVGKDLGKEPEVRIKRTGWKEATTFKGLCGDHDSMFGPVEDGGLNYSVSEHTFLLAYRACMKSVYELRRGVRWQKFGAEELEKRGLVPPKEVNPLRIQAQQFAVNARPAETVKGLLDKYYLARDHTRLEHEVIYVLGPGGIVAASGMFFDRTDASGAPAFMTVNLVPETNRHVLLLSYLQTQREAHQPYIDLFKSHSGLSLRQLTSRLILMRLKSFALRPSLWGSFPPAQQEAIKAAVAQTASPGDVAGISEPKINLFEAAS